MKARRVYSRIVRYIWLIDSEDVRASYISLRRHDPFGISLNAMSFAGAPTTLVVALVIFVGSVLDWKSTVRSNRVPTTKEKHDFEIIRFAFQNFTTESRFL